MESAQWFMRDFIKCCRESGFWMNATRDGLLLWALVTLQHGDGEVVITIEHRPRRLKRGETHQVFKLKFPRCAWPGCRRFATIRLVSWPEGLTRGPAAVTASRPAPS
jgi:hypothetical protein